MTNKTIGSFLSALRKANGMTQQEVADKLNVSNKTVSKWERDEGCPEIMMLPAIAELYSVTVDEILRGERITKPEDEERRTEKSEERMKYLIERALTKFTGSSIVSLVLGAAAFLLTYTIVDIISYNYLWIAYVIIFVLVSASVTVMLVAFNNFSAGAKKAAEVHTQDYEAALRKCISYITAVTFFVAASLLGLIAWAVFDGPDFLFVVFMFAAIVSILIALYTRFLLYKKYAIEEIGLTPEMRQYRKKHIKVTAIWLAAVAVISLILPFACGIIESSTHAIYSFPDGVGYQYETAEEAEREYGKLKGYVTGEKTLYRIISEDYSEKADVCILYAEPLQEYFEHVKGNYNKAGTELMDEEALRFESSKEAEKFKAENVLDDNLEYIAAQRNITFDDETLSVSYQTQNDSFLSGVIDVMPLFILIGSGGFAVVLVASGIIYLKNSKIKKF